MKVILGFLTEVGATGLFLVTILRTQFSTTGNFKPILAQILYVTKRTFSTVAFSGVFVGAILVLQFNLMLQAYDAQSLLGALNTAAVVRQVGPLFISFLLAGKVGA